MQMKERQRWRPEEDGVLRAYVRQYGPREWHLVSQRMNVALDRDAKSCLERWKNYLRPGIKKGALTDDEQRLVIRLQATHGNKWKRIAAEVPGRTAKRLGKWWEVFKEKQQRELRDRRRPSPDPSPDQRGRYEWLLQNFAEKLVGGDHHRPPLQHPVAVPAVSSPALLMAAPVLPPWLSPNAAAGAGGVAPPPRSPSPSVTLSLASSTVAPPPPAPWMPERAAAEAAAAAYGFPSPPPPHPQPPPPPLAVVEGQALAELAESLRELDEGQRAWAAQRREAAWRLRRVEQQLEAEREARRREVWEEFEARMRNLRLEQAAAAERVEREHREKVAELRRDAQVKEEKMAEQWQAKHARVAKFLEQIGCCGSASRGSWSSDINC